jgi:hypothetical protein
MAKAARLRLIAESIEEAAEFAMLAMDVADEVVRLLVLAEKRIRGGASCETLEYEVSMTQKSCLKTCSVKGACHWSGYAASC